MVIVMFRCFAFVLMLFACSSLLADEWWKKAEEYKGKEVRIMFRGAAKPFTFDNSIPKDGFAIYELIHPTVGLYAYHTFHKAPVEYCYVALGKVDEFEKLYCAHGEALSMPLQQKHGMVKTLNGEQVYCFKEKRPFHALLWQINEQYVLVYK